MRRHMLVFISILLVLVFCVGCMRSIVRVNKKTLDISNISDLKQEVQSWIGGITEDGVYIGRITHTRQHEDYYVLINNQRLRDFVVSSHTFEGLNIRIEIVDSANIKTELFKISTINKKPKYIIFLGERFDRNDIPIIQE